MKLQRVEIEGFKGIGHFAFDVGPGGVKIVGKSRCGKTRILEAIYAACKSRGYGPEYITDGHDRWRVLLNGDVATIQTTVRKSGSKEVVVDGLGLGSPQAKLDAFIPDLIDPLKLARDTPAERRRKILAAHFVAATDEDVTRWTGETMILPDQTKHGLDVVKELYDSYYEKRKVANKAVVDAEAAHKLAQDKAESLENPKYVGVVVPLPGKEDEPVRAAEKAHEALEQRKQQAEAQAKRTEGTRAKIAKLLADADAEDASGHAPVSAGTMASLVRMRDMAWAALKEAERVFEQADKAVEQAKVRQAEHDKSDARSAALRAQASELEATLAETAIEPPTADELSAAVSAITEARAHAALVRLARAAHDAVVDAAALGDEVVAAQEEAERLDAIVKRLDKDAPAELASRANLPAGVTFVDDDVALDGHVFKLISESEKLDLCVDLVKRIAPDLGILRIDELEKFDPDLREDFIRRAKSGGWQILGTVVDRGELQIVAIDADDEAPLNPKRRVKVLDNDGNELG